MGKQREGTGYPVRYGDMGGRKWKDRLGESSIGYGEEKDGRRDGRRGW